MLMSMYYDSHAMGRVADAGEGKGGGAQGIGTVRVSLAYRMGRVQSGSLSACALSRFSQPLKLSVKLCQKWHNR